MNIANDDEGDPETRDEIMRATYHAMCKHSYADLTMQAIADEFDKTKAVLHYHYDTKQDLFGAFLAYMLDRFEENFELEEFDTPAERLDALLDAFLSGTGSIDHWRFHTVLLELRAQAPYSDVYRDQFRENDDVIRSLLVTIIEDGIDAGVFNPVDPERTANFLQTVINGVHTRRITLGSTEDPEPARETLDGWLHEELYRS